MAKDGTLRPALLSDCACLAALQCSTMAAEYRGYHQWQQIMNNALEAVCSRFQQAIENPHLLLKVQEAGGMISGYVLYGADESAEGWGLLVEALSIADGERPLIQYALRALAAMGLPNVHTWVLRDNFRLRYLYECCGFRRDGTQCVRQVAEDELPMLRYQYTGTMVCI